MVIADKLVRSPAVRRNRLSSLNNLVKSQRLNKYYQSLTDFNFLEAKINHSEFGVQALIDDYDLIDKEQISSYSEYNISKIKSLKLIQGALKLSAHILNEHKTQLAGQLLIRLQYFKIPEIQAILKQAKQSQAKSWLRPLYPSLTPPGGRLLRTLTGHNGAVLAVTVTPNGKYLISASKDNTIKVWNFQTGEEFFTLSGHSDWVLTLAVTPDSKQVISGSKDKTLKIWSLETGKEIDTLKGHTRPINALVVTPNGKTLISASGDSTFRVWDLENKKEVFNSYNHGYDITALAITPNGEQVILAISNNKIVVWSLICAKKLLTINGHSDIISTLAVTPDGKYLISGSWDTTLKVWNLKTNIFVLKRLLFALIGHSDRITAAVITPNSKLIISDSLDKTHKVWSLETQKEVFSLKENRGEINPLAVTPDGKYLISGSEDNTIKVSSLEEKIEEKFVPSSHNDKVNALAITSNNKYLISSSADNTFKVWSLETGKELFSLNRNDSLSITREKLTIIKDVNDLISLLDALDELPIYKINLDFFLTIDGFYELVNHLSISTFQLSNKRIGKTKFISDRDRIIVWYSRTGEKIFSFQDNFLEVKSLIVTPDNSWVIAGLANKTIKVWDIKDKKNIFTFTNNTNSVTALAVDLNRKRLISGSLDKKMKIWDLENGKELITIKDENFDNKITTTLDGKWILSESLYDNFPLFKVWDISTGEEVFTLTRDDENTLKVYNSSSGRIIASFSVEDKLECCTLASDGITIIGGDELGVVHFFRLEGFPPTIEQTLQEKSTNFVGREFIFTAINKFLNHHDRGYFTIIGAPGSGKSDILIKYMMDSSDVFYYNAQVQGKNRAEEFLKTISNKVKILNETSLQVILQHISDQLEPNQRFIIAIDSLDTIDYSTQASGSNLFYLPRYLPKGIYFLLARRPFIKEKSGLLIEAPSQYFNLKDYSEENRQDIQSYIEKYISKFLYPFSMDKEILGVSKQEFTHQLTSRSENNFMYVNQILAAIKTGLYSQKSFLRDILDTTILDAASLPYDLEAYYQRHLQKIFKGEEISSNTQAVLSILLRMVRSYSPVSVEEISEIINIDEYDVEEILEDWIEFFTLHQIDGETHYSLYHQGFRNWLIKEIM
ncbi:MAG: hypothetical protein AAGM40_11200 [Cyanobacteria bacterium J06573_2]